MRSETELTCEDFVELVSDYLEGALAPEHRTRFEDHLAVCEGCGAYIDQMRTTLRIVRRLRAEDVPEEARDRLLAVFRAWKRGLS